MLFIYREDAADKTLKLPFIQAARKQNSKALISQLEPRTYPPGPKWPHHLKCCEKYIAPQITKTSSCGKGPTENSCSEMPRAALQEVAAAERQHPRLPKVCCVPPKTHVRRSIRRAMPSCVRAQESMESPIWQQKLLLPHSWPNNQNHEHPANSG